MLPGAPADAEADFEIPSPDLCNVDMPHQIYDSVLSYGALDYDYRYLQPNFNWLTQMNGTSAASDQPAWDTSVTLPLAINDSTRTARTLDQRQKATSSLHCNILLTTNTGWMRHERCTKKSTSDKSYLHHFRSHVIPDENGIYFSWLTLDNEEVQSMVIPDLLAFVDSLSLEKLSASQDARRFNAAWLQWQAFIEDVRRVRSTEDASKVITSVFKYCVGKDEITRKKIATAKYRFSTGYYLCTQAYQLPNTDGQ